MGKRRVHYCQVTLDLDDNLHTLDTIATQPSGTFVIMTMHAWKNNSSSQFTQHCVDKYTLCMQLLH